jgi:hypothetical protein
MSKDFADILKALGEPFPADKVSQRAGQGGKKLDYVDWTSVVHRLNEVSPDWETHSTLEHFDTAGTDDKGKIKYVVVIRIGLTVGLVTRYGYGADVDTDPDKAAKTAQAEALKKAANQFGIAIELWDADHRGLLADVRSGNIASLKAAVADLVPGFDEAKDKPAAILTHFGLADDADLSDVDLLYSLLIKD